MINKFQSHKILIVIKLNVQQNEKFTGYCKEGFLNLQHEIFRAILKTYTSFKNETPSIDFQRYPYPPHIKDQYLPALILFISIFIIIMYTYSSVSTIKMITLEKETQMKVRKFFTCFNELKHWIYKQEQFC